MSSVASDLQVPSEPFCDTNEDQMVTLVKVPIEISCTPISTPASLVKPKKAEAILEQNCLGESGNTRQKRTLKGFSLEGKVCVVTGGASGIGLDICRSIVESGGEVAIVDLKFNLAEKQAKLLTESSQSGDHEPSSALVTAHSADVSSPTSIDLAITSILNKHGRIDHLVNSAGIWENFPAISYPPIRMHKLWSINVDGSFYFATAVARHLIQRKVGGSIVLIGSMSGSIVNVPQLQTPYNISKAAVRQMARSLGVEWAKYGIRVNCISPGYIKTALTEEIIGNDPGLYDEWVSRTLVGHLGKPSDIAGAAVFLLCDMSSYMTGAEMLVDGGYSAI